MTADDNLRDGQGEAIPDQQPKRSHRDRLEAERLIDNVIRWAESAPDGLEMFSLRIPNPSPGLVALLEKVAMELREQVGYEGQTPGDERHLERVRHVYKTSGLPKWKLANELQVPEGNIFRWAKPRKNGGTAPSYPYLEKLSAYAKRLGIPGNLLDDSCCQPMTVESLVKPENPPFGDLTTDDGQSDEPTPVLVTFTSAAIRLLKSRSPNPP